MNTEVWIAIVIGASALSGYNGFRLGDWLRLRRCTRELAAANGRAPSNH